MAGRPSDYHEEETIKKAEVYLASCIDEPVKVINEKGEERIIGWRVHLPKAEGLALALEVSRDTLYEWAKHYQAFSDILEKINQVQAERTIDNALGGYYNAHIAKLLLGKHGYKEEKDITSGGKPIGVLLDEADESDPSSAG